MKPPVAVLPLLLAASALIVFAQDGPDQKPNVFLQNDRTKQQKPSTTRLIDGIVKDAAGNAIPDAIVQLKNTKTSMLLSSSLRMTADTCSAIFRWISISSCWPNTTT